MPEIKFKHVVSCNSQDKQFPASNLVTPESFKKWKCMPGVEQAIVILQLDHAVKMHTMDIGNFGSAFIEVLAGHSATINDPTPSANNNESYDLLLASQSFMSPTESRSESYCSRVRLFNSKEHFEAESLDKKYDRIKVICTQPYNKNVGYGLAFIRCCSVDENPPKPVATTNIQNPFLRLASNAENLDDNPSETSFTPGSLFRNRAKLGRDSEEKPKTQSTARVETAREKKEENGKKKVKENIVKKLEIKERNKEVNGTKKDDDRRNSDVKKNVKLVPFGRLLSGVTFVLSGFENPYRSELRDKAIEMGAKYQPDWSSSGRCTHLICAFADTPKYNQVLGKGKIVKHQWILDSYKQKRRLNWKDYAFEGALNKGKIYSDDEELVAESEKSQKVDKEPISREAKKTEIDKDSPSSLKKGKVLTEDEIYDAPTDYSDSPADTDEEIERAKKRQKRKVGKNDPVVESTNNSKKHKLDESEPQSAPKNADFDEDGLPILPEFFRNMIFLIHSSNTSQIVRKQLNRYIVAFGGDLENYMNDKVTHVLTDEKWTDDFEEASLENSKLLFVNLDWVLECGRLERLVDIGEYLILK